MDSVLKPSSGIFGLIAQVSVDWVAIVLIGARKEAIVLVGVILAIVVVVVLGSWFSCLILHFAEEVRRSDGTWGDAHDEQVEEADEGHQNGHGRVDWVLCVKEEQGDEDHEKSLSIQEAQELEVLEHALPLELGNEEQPSEWEQIEGQNVEEGVRGRIIFTEVRETDDSCGAEAEYDEKVEDVSDVVEAVAVHLLIILICHLNIWLNLNKR